MSQPLSAAQLKTLIEALEAFSTPCPPTSLGNQVPDKDKTFRCVEVGEYGRRISLTMETVCRAAAQELGRRDSDAAKFRTLINALRARGLDRLYEELMREPMP